jgi:hypothetical protein
LGYRKHRILSLMFIPNTLTSTLANHGKAEENAIRDFYSVLRLDNKNRRGIRDARYNAAIRYPLILPTLRKSNTTSKDCEDRWTYALVASAS